MATVPAISVLLPVRDGEDYLDAAIASLVRQSWQDFEIVAIDNGSTDRSPDILRAWADRESRLRLLHRETKGLAGSLNQAAAAARAPLLARLDGDDIALPQRLEAQIRYLAKRPETGLLGSFVDLIDPKGGRVGVARLPTSDAAIRESLRKRCTFVHSTVMMRRDLFEKVGGYRETLHYAEDFDLWCRMAEQSEVAILPRVLVQYRLHPSSATARGPAKMAIGAALVRAAAEARERGYADPLSNAGASLRKSLDLLGETKPQFIRETNKQAIRQAVFDLYVRLPLPGSVKYALRRAAIRIGLKPLHSLWLELLGLVYIPASRRRRSLRSESPRDKERATGR